MRPGGASAGLIGQGLKLWLGVFGLPILAVSFLLVKATVPSSGLSSALAGTITLILIVAGASVPMSVVLSLGPLVTAHRFRVDQAGWRIGFWLIGIAVGAAFALAGITAGLYLADALSKDLPSHSSFAEASLTLIGLISPAKLAGLLLVLGGVAGGMTGQRAWLASVHAMPGRADSGRT
jgi:hypothetical protein